MKTAIISSTCDDNYLFFIPIVTWAWNKIGVDVICFLPIPYVSQERWEKNPEASKKAVGKCIFIERALNDFNLKCRIEFFSAPEHKEATYAQVSRLSVGCLDLPKTDDAIITSDADMLPLSTYLNQYPGDVVLFGADLLEGEKMFPMCYCSMTYQTWQEVMETKGKTHQQFLDEKLGAIEAEHFRGNYWCFDQELLYNQIGKSTKPVTKFNRAKYPERFATKRYDRDDAYLLDRLNPDTIDYHMPRPGYEQNNFNQIMTVLKYHFPYDDLNWISEYRNNYIELL